MLYTWPARINIRGREGEWKRKRESRIEQRGRGRRGEGERERERERGNRERRIPQDYVLIVLQPSPQRSLDIFVVFLHPNKNPETCSLLIYSSSYSPDYLKLNSHQRRAMHMKMWVVERGESYFFTLFSARPKAACRKKSALIRGNTPKIVSMHSRISLHFLIPIASSNFSVTYKKNKIKMTSFFFLFLLFFLFFFST